MSFYLRKSVKVGPLRFNISKSGIGVSAGVRGLRVGTGPRGNYVHIGSNGLYYRQTLPSVTRPARSRSSPSLDRQPGIPDNTHDPLTEIESADVAQMVDSSSAELLAELNKKQKKRRLWPAMTIFGLILLGWILSTDAPPWGDGITLILVVIGIFLTARRDRFAKTVILLFDFDEEMEKQYQLLHDQAAILAESKKIWHIEASGRVRDRKYHAGASQLVRRKPTVIRKAAPPNIKTNIATIAIGVGRQTLHFFPDRLLIYDYKGVGAVAYPDLHLKAVQTRFIEDESVPRDAQIVDRTWQYVNRNGGPDRRFKNNRQLPVCLYDELFLQSESGLNELIQLSKSDTAEGFVQTVDSLAKRIEQAPENMNGMP